MVEHHDEIIAAAAGERIRRAAFCAEATRLGLTDRGGRPSPERNARETWHVALLRWRDAEAQLAGEGVIITAPVSGVPAVNLWHGIARTAAVQLARLETELCLSPARRRNARRSPRPLLANGSPAPMTELDKLIEAGAAH